MIPIPLPQNAIKDHQFSFVSSEAFFSKYFCPHCKLFCLIFNTSHIHSQAFLWVLKLYDYPDNNPPFYYLKDNEDWQKGKLFFSLSCAEMRIRDIIL